MCSFTEKVQDTGVLEIHSLFLFNGCCLRQTAVELAMKLGLGVSWVCPAEFIMDCLEIYSYFYGGVLI